MLKGKFPLEKFATMQTPFYYYDMELLSRTLDEIKTHLRPDWHMHYAVKANFNPALLRRIAAAGFGADCVSGGEVRAALDAGFKAGDIFFAGVGKSDAEILLGLRAGIGRFNVESQPELEVINELALREGKTAPVSFRVNPDLGAHTDSHIATGKAENKFGINLEQIDDVIRQALTLPGIQFLGLHFHIGSQILDMGDFEALCKRINGLRSHLESLGLPCGDVNVGGGLGINYEHPNHLYMADFADYFDTFGKYLDVPAGCLVHFELGRSVVAPCGSLITKVLYVKKGTVKTFAVVDASMTQLIRPALYKAYHRIENLSSDDPEQIYDIVGPVCESSDVFLKDTPVDECHRGDLLAIRSAGAYGESMASRYNLHELPGSLADPH